MRVGYVIVVVTWACGPQPRGFESHDASPGSPPPSDGSPGGIADGAVVPSDGAAAPIDSPTPSGGLDPDLVLPNPGGQVCDDPGAIGSPECPAIEVCRMFSPTEGRCETCFACGNLGDFCTATDQCDILFECFQGSCTNFCTLGTFECGPIEDCIHVGHATRGVCRP